MTEKRSGPPPEELSKEASRAAQLDRRGKSNPRPGLLDVVLLDGMWAQVCPTKDQVKFLGDLAEGHNEAIDVDWDRMDFEPYFATPTTNIPKGHVMDLVKNGEITNEEYLAVRWGPEQEKNPELRQHVTVCGKYSSKKI